ncbi:unnamed protein product [Camellia sinensis]
MLKDEGTGNVVGIGTNNWQRVCDTCHSAASAVYCRADSAYLCTTCDARIHTANSVAARHERVRVCEACERAPAAFLCKADAASLCPSCDDDIHAANPLASRHHRVPIMPIPACLFGPPAPGGSEADGFFANKPEDEAIGEEDEDEDESGSWLLHNVPVKNNTNQNTSNGFLFGGEVIDEYLDLVDYNTCEESQFTDQYCGVIGDQKNYGGGGGDRVVPVQHQQQQNYQLGMETGFCCPVSISHTVSISSMDVGVVPDSTMSDDVSVSVSVSASHSRPPKGTIDLFSSPLHMPSQLSPMDREARVLRYREKKKARKFEKTIRYASRKAYAETRPRIKGRFAKRTDVEVDVDQMFSATLMADGGYGIVPSF